MIRDTASTDQVIRSAASSPKRKWIKPLLIAGIPILLLVWALSIWLSSSRSINVERVRIAKVTRGDLVRDAQVNGRVVAAVSPTLYAPVEGIVNLKIFPGDQVKVGDILASLESPELRAELQREQSTLQTTEVELARGEILAQQQKLVARKNADEAELALIAANRDRERIAKACDKGVLPKVDCLKSEDDLKSAKIRSEHAANDASLESKSVGFEAQTKRKTLERQRLVVNELLRRIEELKIRAPVAGIVGSVAVVDRAQVAANAPLLTVVDLTRLEVELSIPESFAEDLGLGMQVELDLAGIKTVGELSSIAPEVLNNQVAARARFATQPEGVRQNQRVAARILIENKPNVINVARGPFFEQLGGRNAYVMENDIAVKRAIQFGASSLNAIEILSGAKIGEEIVISGSDAFADAERVRINR